MIESWKIAVSLNWGTAALGLTSMDKLAAPGGSTPALILNFFSVS
jgi:hypothetical protein